MNEGFVSCPRLYVINYDVKEVAFRIQKSLFPVSFLVMMWRTNVSFYSVFFPACYLKKISVILMSTCIFFVIS